MSGSTFAAWDELSARVMVLNGTKPNPANFRAMLLNGLTVTRSTSKAALVSAEVLGSGYTRAAYAPAGGVWDPSQNRFELSQVNLDFAVSGTSLQWSAWMIMADASATAALTMGAINTTTDRITITGHNLTSAAEVAVTSTDTRPGGLVADTLYFVRVIDANTIDLHTTSALNTLVDITSAGVGTHSLRIATGTPAIFNNVPSQTVGAGSTQPLRIDWAFLNAGNVNGV